MLDRAKAVRPGEELNPQALTDYLNTALPGSSGGLEIEQFPRGFSNLTYLVKWGNKELVLRRPPLGANIKSAHDMTREYRILQGLNGVFKGSPKPLVLCQDETVLGATFYVMERVSGVILRNAVPPELTLDAQTMGELSNAFVSRLGELHKVDWRAAGLLDFDQGPGYVDRQISGWRRRYQKAQTDEVVEMAALGDWLDDHRPADSDRTLIHNDYKYDNLVLNPSRLPEIIAVLDWEMATIGDPLMDLGTSLGYWAEADDPPALTQFGLTRLDGNLSREELVNTYEEITGRQVNNRVFYFAYGAFKLGVIAQQIYARFKLGMTKDPRFGGLIHVVRACARLGVKAVEKDRISALHSKES